MATRKIINQQASTKKPRGKITKRLKNARHRIIPIVLVFFGALALGAAGTVLWWSRDLPDPQKISNRQVVESTKIFDRTGTHLLYEIGEIRRTAVALDQVSKHVVSATLATEDDQFYDHHGLDFKGIIRGVIFKPLSGQRAQGGSTITQQLIKNSILTPERTVQRKVKEAVLALELEQRFTKDEIFEMYLNEIPYGSQSYGIEAAAQTFFNSTSSNVTLAQAAILAALPKAPTYYSPYGSHFEDLKRRQESTLDRMVDLNMISEDESNSAKAEELDFQPQAEAINAPHFVFYIREQLEAEYGERVVEQGGLKVTTTLDMRLQTIAEEVLDDRQEQLTKLGASNSALVAIDPRSGDILTMVGSIDYFNEEIDGNVNVAIRHRSPGSSLKPFIYTAAWSKGFTPETILVDAETDFGQEYMPKNYDLGESGPVTMRHALANSLNIPAVKALYLAGVNESTELAQKMGMSSLDDPDRYGLSLVLGGGEVRLVDEVSAYGVFANDGVRHPHRAILQVADNEEVLFDATEEEPVGEEIIPADLARLTTNVISDNNARATAFGTNSALQLGSRPVAAKTGTTQDFRDGWTMGFTPSLAAGVWAGNNDNTPMGKSSAGIRTASPTWNTFMRRALEGTPIESFVPPNKKTSSPHSILKGEIAETKGKWEQNSNIFYTSECPVALGRPTTFKELRSLLFYVTKSNPQGPAPADAENDPQYKRWEEAIATWRDKHNEENKTNSEEPQYVDSLPIPECSAENSEDLPKVFIRQPSSAVVRQSEIDVDVDVESELAIKEVRFLFDGKEIATKRPGDSYSATINVPTNFSGRKTLVVLAITENDLIGRAHRTLIINPDDTTPSITLHTPQSGKKYSPSNFPLTAKVTAQDDSGIELVDVLYSKEDSPGTHRIGRTSKQSSVAPNRFELIWDDSPGPGKYNVWAVTYDKTGNPAESNHHSITID